MDQIIFEHPLFLVWLLIPSHCIIQLFHSTAPIIHSPLKRKIDYAEIKHPLFHFLAGVTLEKIN